MSRAAAHVRIERLVLDIPGFDPANSRALALRIADGLAQAGLSGEHASVSVSLPHAAMPPGNPIPR